MILIWPVSFWLIILLISIALSIGAHFLQFDWRKILKTFLSPISFNMLSGWGILGAAVGFLVAGIWFRPPLVILGLSIGTIIGFFTAKTSSQEVTPLERLGWILLVAIGGMLFSTFTLKIDNMEMGAAIGVKVLTLIGVLGQGAYALYNNWVSPTKASDNLQDRSLIDN